MKLISKKIYPFLFLTGVRPDVFQQTVVLSQTVQRVIGFPSRSNVTRQSVGNVFAWDGTTFFIDLSDVDLDGGVVLGLDDSVGSRTLSWNVKFDLMIIEKRKNC